MFIGERTCYHQDSDCMCIERINRESVQPSQLQLLSNDGVVAYGFVGKAQTELSFEPVAVIQDLGERANLLNLWRGASALDFYVATCTEQIGAADADAFFCITSKCKGFDPPSERWGLLPIESKERHYSLRHSSLYTASPLPHLNHLKQNNAPQTEKSSPAKGCCSRSGTAVHHPPPGSSGAR